MHDTPITIVGNVATKPERRRIERTGDSVLNFRLASTSRRFDKAAGDWVDGNSLFVRVNCWRALADNAFHSLYSGDPVIVTGRLYTREYVGDDGHKRVSLEMDATAVGHNMTRGTTTFSKRRPAHPTDMRAEEEPPPQGEPVDDEGMDAAGMDVGSMDAAGMDASDSASMEPEPVGATG